MSAVKSLVATGPAIRVASASHRLLIGCWRDVCPTHSLRRYKVFAQPCKVVLLAQEAFDDGLYDIVVAIPLVDPVIHDPRIDSTGVVAVSITPGSLSRYPLEEAAQALNN